MFFVCLFISIDLKTAGHQLNSVDPRWWFPKTGGASSVNTYRTWKMMRERFLSMLITGMNYRL